LSYKEGISVKSRQDRIQKILRKLYGKPCWDARKGHSSFLTFEFGKPQVYVHEPFKPWNGKSPPRPAASRRAAWIHGEWHLWIYMCKWTILQDGVRRADSASTTRRIERAVITLQGQALRKVSVDRVRGRSRFEFDYGGVVETKRSERMNIQWILHDPKKGVLEIRGDGKHSYAHESSPAGLFLER
jgi:hypothetical protein